MAHPKTSQIYINGVSVVVFDYEKAGDTLPVHEHTKALWQEHFVIVCSGEFEVLTGSTDAPTFRTFAGPGDIVTWPPGTPHGFRAKTDNARAMHIRSADLRDISVPAGERPGAVSI